MTTKSQLSTIKSKKQKQTKQTTRTGIESQKWRSFGGLLAGRRKGENEEKYTGIKKHNWQIQIDRGVLRIVEEMKKPKNLYARTMNMN